MSYNPNDPKIQSPLLAELEDRERSLRQQLGEVGLSIKAERLKLVEELYHVKVGSIVRFRGVEHRVTEIDATWGDKPWVSGNPRKKDGSFGTAHRNLFSDWTLVQS